MNPELEKKLLEDLEKTGFSSEMRAIKTFLSHKWRCTGFASYYDLDHEQTRQIDLRAYKIKSEQVSKETRISVDYLIDAEVKKSEKPWIVFKEELEKIWLTDAWNNLIEYRNLGCEPHEISDAITQDSLIKKLEWTAYGIHESFKKPEAPSRWYSAFANVCKSAESTLEKNTSHFKWETEKRQSSSDSHDLVFVKPIVILDGLLFSAGLSETADLQLEEIKFAPTEFDYKSKSCTRGRYYVDVVSLHHLSEYIELSEKRQKSILDAMKSVYDKTVT